MDGRIVLFNRVYASPNWRAWSAVSTAFDAFGTPSSLGKLGAQGDSEASILSVPVSISLPADCENKIYVDKDYSVVGTSDYNYYIDREHLARYRKVYAAYLVLCSLITVLLGGFSVNTIVTEKISLMLVPALILLVGIGWRYYLVLFRYRNRQNAGVEIR
jgi:hypothetical protein